MTRTCDQLSLFSPLDHLTRGIAREMSLLTAYERKQVLAQLYTARDLIRDADERLVEIRERRAKRGPKKGKSE